MRLLVEDLIFLKSELSKTRIMNEEDLAYIKASHPQLYFATHLKKDEGVSLFPNKSWVYTLENKELNEFICNKFEEPIDNLYIIHRLIYGENGYAKKHKDRFTTHKTVSILLSSDFTGGEMYINDENILLKNEGDYVVFNGGNESHEVKRIITGERDVLIVWFSKKKAKFSII
jgi:hypothetical protein